MAAYMIIESKAKNPETYQQYIARVPEIVARYGGRYLARGGRVLPLMGGWTPERVILLEFPSEAHIHQWLSSPEYQAIAPLREAGAEIRAVVVQGYTDQKRQTPCRPQDGPWNGPPSGCR
ncbi:MAG: DUF1330 domain-containing protein [Phycisphaerae bacterium]|nr:DUF1330 domain-containing protein [Phycisphaerae bacterium]